MSDSSIDWNPLMLDPSNPVPFANKPSFTSLIGTETCCQTPGRSINFISKTSHPLSFISFNASLDSFAILNS